MMGPKEREWLQKLQKGIPAEEAPVLLQAVQEERARAKAPKANPLQFDDPRAQRLSDLWFSQRATATVEQKNRIGLAYIAKVLALGDEVARLFAEGNQSAYHRVGMRLGATEQYTPDIRGFWEEMRELFLDTYRDEDIAYLVEHGGVYTVWHLMWQIEVTLAEDSPVLRRLAENAHMYK